MKKINFLLLFVVVFLFNSCGGSGNGDTPPGGNATACKNVNSLSVVQNGENLHFTITSDLPGPYEIGVQHTGAGYPYDRFVSNEKVFTKSINSVNGMSLPGGQTFSFFVRRICSAESKSDWGYEKSLTISNNFCRSPYNVAVDYIYNRITWNVDEYPSSNGEIPTYYQVQYGPQGFALGSGTTINSNVKYYNAPFVAGNNYDIYVRTYCSLAGWGGWVGPYTFNASNTTACVAPASASYTTQTGGTNSLFTATINFENDFVSQYQISLSTSSAVPAASSMTNFNPPGYPVYTNLTKGTNYYFYARKVCANNTYSPYFGPFLVKWN